MRKRVELESMPTPAPCAHPIVTWHGVSAPACMWGTSDGPPFPRAAYGTPTGDTMERAYRDHFRWEAMRRVPRAEVLDPDGRHPFVRQPRIEA